jgi:hypothetical protein
MSCGEFATSTTSTAPTQIVGFQRPSLVSSGVPGTSSQHVNFLNSLSKGTPPPYPQYSPPNTTPFNTPAAHTPAQPISVTISSPPNISPTTFNSKSSNVTEWLENFDRYVRATKITENVVDVFVLSLDDTARRLVSGMLKTISSKTEEEKLEAAKRTLSTTFRKPGRTVDDYQAAFQSRDQREHETHALYIAELRKLYDKGFPNCNDADRERAIINRLCRGLRSALARSRANLERNKSLEVVIKALDDQAIFESDEASRSRATDETAKQRAIIAELEERVLNQENLLNQRNQPQQQRSHHQPNGNPCYICNSPSHMTRDCQAPRSPAQANRIATNRSKNRIEGSCLMNGHVVQYLLDTGADVTAINQNTFDRINPTVVSCLKDVKPTTSVEHTIELTNYSPIR